MHRFLLLSATLLILPLSAQAQNDRLTVSESADSQGTGVYVDLVTVNGPSVTITQTPLLFIENGGVACGNAALGYTTENSFWRVFDLSEYPEITDDFNVTEAGVGVWTTTFPPEIPAQTVNVNLYTLSEPPLDGVFLAANLTQVGSADYEYDGTVTGVGGEIITVPVTGTFSPTDLMAVEYFVPSGNYETNPTIPEGLYFSMRDGINAEIETAPHYLSSESCGIIDPTILTLLNPDFSNRYWVLTVTGTVMGSASEEGPTARRVTLGDAYPNPAVGQAVIPFTLAEAAQVEVTIYDVRGREVAVVANGPFAAGEQSVTFDASRLPSGTYVYSVNANGQMLTQQMVVLD